jgi:hypothetical protein
MSDSRLESDIRLLKVIANIFKLKKFKDVKVDDYHKRINCNEDIVLVKKVLRSMGFAPRKDFEQHWTKAGRGLIEIKGVVQEYDQYANPSKWLTMIHVIIGTE